MRHGYRYRCDKEGCNLVSGEGVCLIESRLGSHVVLCSFGSLDRSNRANLAAAGVGGAGKVADLSCSLLSKHSAADGAFSSCIKDGSFDPRDVQMSESIFIDFAIVARSCPTVRAKHFSSG